MEESSSVSEELSESSGSPEAFTPSSLAATSCVPPAMVTRAPSRPSLLLVTVMLPPFMVRSLSACKPSSPAETVIVPPSTRST